MLLDVSGKLKRVLSNQPFGEVAIAGYKRIDDRQVFADGAGGAAVVFQR